MRWHFILKIIGVLIFFLGLSMIFPLLWGIYYSDTSIIPLITASSLTLLSGLAFLIFFKNSKIDQISSREGMAIVAIGWTIVCFFGAMPFYFSPDFNSFTDAFFESVSGFTTTGSSILTDIEKVSKGLLFWRNFIQWLGGMGIIVLSMAILPFLKVGGMQLYKAEVPGPAPDKLKPKIRETAKIMWKVYLLISAAQFILLMLGGMSVYDAMCHTFSTMPTGGFSPKNTSIAHFNSLYFDIIITIFMIMAGINFSLHYQLIRGKGLAFWRDSECRFFLTAVLLMILIVSFDIFGTVYDSIYSAVRYGSFQVASIVTTTGFVTADYEKWPAMSKLILFMCMFIGASAGSTGGGMKCVRIILCFKYCYRELFALIHPRSVSYIKIAGKTIPDDILKSVMGFLALYMGLFLLCSILLSSIGVDFITALSAVAASIGNVGPGFALVGPTGNYGSIPYIGKWLLIWCMLLGRLEIFTVLILLVPEFWRK